MFDFNKWATEFRGRKNSPMSVEMTQTFFVLSLADVRREERHVPELENSFMYRLISSRAEYIGLTLTEPAKAFLTILCESAGTAVMYLYVLRSVAPAVNMTQIAETFPIGFLVEESLSEAWGAQKLEDGNNGLDCLDLVTLGWR